MYTQAEKDRLVEIIHSFEVGGAERLAAAIAIKASDAGVSVAVCAVNGIGGPIRDQLKKKGIACYGMDRASISPITLRYRLYKLFRELRPAVIHMHQVSQLVFAYWPAKLARVPRLVLTEHANYSIRVKPRLNKLARLYCKKADVVTTVHDGLKEYFNEELNVAREKLLTIPNGIDTRIYKPGDNDSNLKRKLKISKDTLIMCCIGRLVEAKDHGNILKAIQIVVKERCTKIALLIVGDGPLRDDIMTQIHKLNIENHVYLLGTRDDIEEILHNSDICVLPSKRESFPMVLLEAMSCGVPCIATAVGAIPQLIDDDDSGLVVLPENSEAMAGAIMRMYSQKEKIANMGWYARNKILKNYDINDVFKRYLDVLFR